MKLFILLVMGLRAAAVSAVGSHYDCSHCQPEQIHISLGEDSNDIVVTWSTFEDSLESVVEFGVAVNGVMDRRVVGSKKKFVDGGLEQRSQYIHTVTLADLQYSTTYIYHVGSRFGWSELLTFRTPPGGQSTVRAAIYGDLGSENAHSLSYLQDEAERGHFDMILHVGDFAYDMDSDGARVGDQFMRQIQPIASLVPYMTCPGNHEQAYNFSNYAARFTMPGPDSSLFYSFDLGPVHFVSVSTEVYYFQVYGFELIPNQIKWLEEDLRIANLPENRLIRPWIILFGHRPMYCSNQGILSMLECPYELTRVGLTLLTIKGKYALEPLLSKYGVDVAIWGHEHSYERTWPLYDNRVYNGSLDKPYVNPRAPIHIVTGSAGCKENTDKFVDNPQEWSAFRSSDYGYTRFVAYNQTHIYFEQVDVDLDGKVIDSFYVVQNKHGPFGL